MKVICKIRQSTCTARRAFTPAGELNGRLAEPRGGEAARVMRSAPRALVPSSIRYPPPHPPHPNSTILSDLTIDSSAHHNTHCVSLLCTLLNG